MNLRNREVPLITIQNSLLSVLWSLRHQAGRDLRIIITSTSTSTGMHKTTLGIWLANHLDQNQPWTARERGFHADIDGYKTAYSRKEKHPRGSCFVLDELEDVMDRRRAMSSSNVDLRQIWAKGRDRGILGIAISPSLDLIDPDSIRLADVWIQIHQPATPNKPGHAELHYVYSKDPKNGNKGEIKKRNFFRAYPKNFQKAYPPNKTPNGKESFPWEVGKEILYFPWIHYQKYPGIMMDMAYMDKAKDTDFIQDIKGSTKISQKEHKKGLQKAKREKRNTLMKAYYEKCDCLTQREIAEIVGLKQGTVNQILNE